MDELTPRILWWNIDARRWQEIPWDAWRNFRGPDIGSKVGDGCLRGVPAGDHRFALCIMDECGSVANVITHRYIIGDRGELVSSVDGLSDDERKELDRLYLLHAPSLEDDARLADIRAKWGAKLTLPHEAAMALMRDLPGPPVEDRNCGVWRFFAEVGIPDTPRSKH